jgi:beta-N-acetylhexosaminidase
VGALRLVASTRLRFVTTILIAAIVAGCVAPVAAAGGSRSASGPATATAGPAPTSGTAAAAAPTPRPTPVARRSPIPTLSQIVGQKLVVAMDGTTPSASLLGRIERGEVGGVILFGRNISTAAALKALTKRLRDAAAAGGPSPLLIAVDQEGGSIKRIPWAPPTLSPPQIGADGRAATARSQGAATGTALAALGINVDLAPVADVPASTSSFLYQPGRTFSFSASLASSLANAFAAGLTSTGVLPTMKHFPGLGVATVNTDNAVLTIGASKAALDPGLTPYRAAVVGGLPIVMLSNATYTAYDPANAAGWSHAIGVDLLRDDLGFRGITITDSLDGTAHARGVTTASLAIRAAAAGTDLILVTGSEATSAQVFTALFQAARTGTIARSTLNASYGRIRDLKAGL